jgi:cytochrome d ubiquinol oxidase subunit II
VALAWVMLGLIVAVSLWTPFLNPMFLHRWFGWPGILLTSPVPLLVAALAIAFAWGIRREHHLTPFLCALGIFVLCFAGLGVSFYPLMVPPDITIWQAAAPRASQLFVLVGASVLIPLILCYSGFSYWVFRGKVQAGAHYH